MFLSLPSIGQEEFYGIALSPESNNFIDSLSTGLIPFLLLTAILSISLGAFNLLPLPMLDGGQFLFILFEEVIGTPINMKLKVALFNLSYMFILALFIFVVYNDLMRIF